MRRADEWIKAFSLPPRPLVWTRFSAPAHRKAATISERSARLAAHKEALAQEKAPLANRRERRKSQNGERAPARI